MAEHRLFVSQETLDEWLSVERVSVDGDVLTLRDDTQRFRLKTAVHFLSEVAGGGDDAMLIGKVKDVEVLAAMGGEHVSDSVILNDSAYEVVEGFLGEPLPREGTEAVVSDALPKHEGPPSGSDLESAARAATGDAPSDEVDALARFFLGQR